MSEWLKALFVSIFGTNSALATFIISMVPIVELRGAIPFGSAKSFWGDNALSLWSSFFVSVAGSTLVCLILTFAFMPLFKWLKKTKVFKKLADFVEKKLSKNSSKINKKTEDVKSSKKVLFLKLFGVFIFVAFPIPLTGVWTGTCLALFIGLNYYQTILTVIPGNIIAGLIMTLISYFFSDNTVIVLYAFVILVVIFILFELVKKLIFKLKDKKSGEQKSEEVVEISNENNSGESQEVGN